MSPLYNLYCLLIDPYFTMSSESQIAKFAKQFPHKLFLHELYNVDITSNRKLVAIYNTYQNIKTHWNYCEYIVNLDNVEKALEVAFETPSSESNASLDAWKILHREFMLYMQKISSPFNPRLF